MKARATTVQPKSNGDRPVNTRPDPALSSAENHEQVLRANELALQRIQAMIGHGPQDRRPSGSDAAFLATKRGERPRAAAPEGPRTSLEQVQQDWLQRLLAIEARIAGLEARVEKAADDLEADVLDRLHLSFGEAIRQARERIKRYTVACGQSCLVELEAELERRLEPFLSQSQEAISNLGRLSDPLGQEHELLTDVHSPESMMAVSQ